MKSPLPIDMLMTFLEIIECGSFNSAAKQVNRTQSAVSMQIKRLEEIIGKTLFTREGRGSALTPEGETLAEYARRIVRLNNEAVSQLTHPHLAGLVKVGIPDDYTTRFLPEILADFSRTYAMVQVEVTVLASFELIKLLKSGKLDLVLSFMPEPSVQKSRLIRQEPTVWVTSEHHSIEETRPVPLALAPTNHCVFRSWAMKGLEKAGVDYRIAFTSDSILGHIAAVSAGIAVSIMSESIVPEGLKIIPACSDFPPLPISNIYLLENSEEKKPALETLAQHIIKTFQ